MKGMEKVEIVIKIPKAYYELILERCKDPVLLNAFKNGTLLPKGHGNLKDEDEIYELLNSINGTAELDKAFEAVEQAITIIEAENKRGER